MQDKKPAIQQMEAANRRLKRAVKLLNNAGLESDAKNVESAVAYIEGVVRTVKRRQEGNVKL